MIKGSAKIDCISWSLLLDRYCTADLFEVNLHITRRARQDMQVEMAAYITSAVLYVYCLYERCTADCTGSCAQSVPCSVLFVVQTDVGSIGVVLRNYARLQLTSQDSHLW